MENDKISGYSKEEYYKISTKLGLPKRCPILRDCCRAVLTRFHMGFKMHGSDIAFAEFIESEGQRWDEAKMIKSIEKIDWSSIPDCFESITNTCPEVTLFEAAYLPFNFKQTAFGEGAYYKERRCFEGTAKHYSECAEFSEYAFHNTKKDVTKGKRKRSPISQTTRIEIFQRDDFRCYYCKRHKDDLPRGVNLTIDHKVPYSDGGDDSLSNLVAACSECNSGKSNKIIKNI